MMSQTRAARSPWDSALTSPLPSAAGDKDGERVEEEVGKCDGKAVSLFSTVSTFISTAGSVFPIFFNFDCSSSSSWLMKLSLWALLWDPSFRLTSCIFDTKELFLLPSLEVEELFLELELERRLTEPLEQTTSSENETREVRPELGFDPDDEPGTAPEVVDERRLQESEGRLSVRSTGTTTGLSFEQVAQLATLSLARRGGPWSPLLQKLSFAILECPASRSRY